MTQKIFELKERHDIDELDIEFVNKNFFTNNFIVDIFVFVIAIILVITTIIIIYALCKHNKLIVLVMSLALQQVKEVKAEEIRNRNYKHDMHIPVLYNFSFKYSNNRLSCISQFYRLEE